MPNYQWVDVTSYEPGQKRIPTCWEIKDKLFRVGLAWNHHSCPGMWVFYCRQLDCDTRSIPGLARLDQVAEAKGMALLLCLGRASQLQEHLREAFEQTRCHKFEEAPVRNCECRTCCSLRRKR